jgi:hypothetical protein
VQDVVWKHKYGARSGIGSEEKGNKAIKEVMWGSLGVLKLHFESYISL